MEKTELFEGLHEAARDIGIGPWGNLSDEDQIKFALAFSNMTLARAIEAQLSAKRA